MGSFASHLNDQLTAAQNEVRLLREQLNAERACRRTLAHGARGLLIDLPIKRDWCNPDNERMLHEGVRESARLDKEGS